LQNNQFKTFPNAVIGLKLLRKLNVKGNKLTELPLSIWRMKKLRRFYTQENPWDGKWSELLRNTTAVILEECRKGDSINVFLSHAWDDQRNYRILELEANLENRDEIYEVFICEEDLVGDIREFMDEKVPQSNLLLFLATKNSLKSEACRHELALALSNQIEIVPLKSRNLEWQDLKKIDLSGEGYGIIDLSEKKGFEFATEDFEAFCDDLYQYITQFKREVNLYDPKKAEIDKIALNIKSIILNLIESNNFRKVIKQNRPQLIELYQNFIAKQITAVNFYREIGKILSVE
jgi:Leucine-rich repeat (LRR) protein